MKKLDMAPNRLHIITAAEPLISEHLKVLSDKNLFYVHMYVTVTIFVVTKL